VRDTIARGAWGRGEVEMDRLTARMRGDGCWWLGEAWCNWSACFGFLGVSQCAMRVTATYSLARRLSSPASPPAPVHGAYPPCGACAFPLCRPSLSDPRPPRATEIGLGANADIPLFTLLYRLEQILASLNGFATLHRAEYGVVPLPSILVGERADGVATSNEV
jgi:hypothetical protein